ncbi:MFS transporter [Myxococcota bacterium]|nr:MFS transporter [Myxococcota bacterium]
MSAHSSTPASSTPAPSTGSRRVDFSTKFFYGFGSVAYGVKDNAFAYLLLLYYNQVLGLPAGWVGTALMATLIVDAFSDPIVGYASDNFHSRWGRRHPFMYASVLPVAVSFYFLWNPPANLSPQWLFAYLLGVAIAVRTCITFFEIPSSSLVAELTDDYDERTSLMSYRYFFGWWGGLAMATLAFLVLLPPEKGGVLYVGGYRTYGAIAAVVMAVAILISAGGTHRHIPSFKQPPPPRPFDLGKTLGELRETLANRSFAALFFSAIFTAMAAGLSSALNVYFNSFFWGFSSTQIAYLMLPIFLSAILAMAVAPALSRRIGKKYAAVCMALLAGVGAPMPILLRLLEWFPANGTDKLFYSMLAFNAIEVTLIVSASILVSAMVADVVEESELRTGRRSEGVFFAARSFAGKTVHGIGAFTATLILTVVDFPANAVPGEVSPSILRDLGIAYVPVLMTVYILSLLMLFGYRISRADHVENVRRLSDSGG